MNSDEQLVQGLYDRFNARDMDGVLASLAEDVAWANGQEGGHIHGREAVRAYWTHQWSVIDPHVEPLNIDKAPDGSTFVKVRQTVRDLRGKLLLDESIVHNFHIKKGHVVRFDITSASKLSTISQ